MGEEYESNKAHSVEELQFQKMLRYHLCALSMPWLRHVFCFVLASRSHGSAVLLRISLFAFSGHEVASV